MTAQSIYEFKIGLDGTVSYVTVFTFIMPPGTDEIVNIIANEKFLYIFGDSNVYVSPIGSDGIVQLPVISRPYKNDPTFPVYAYDGMQFSPDGEDFYAVDSPDGTLWFCHYTTNGDGTINFPAKDCQNVLSNILSGEAFGANGLYIPPSGKFLYGLAESDVGETCSAAIFAYTIGNNGALSPLNLHPFLRTTACRWVTIFAAKPFFGRPPTGSMCMLLGRRELLLKGLAMRSCPSESTWAWTPRSPAVRHRAAMLTPARCR
jgi:hypothetical protein